MAQTGYAEVNGARLYYEIEGDGPALVFVHAGVADSRMWDAQIPAFAPRFQVIRFDMRGFGKSSMPPGPFAMRDDLYGLLQYLEVERARLVAASMGGSVAIDFTLEQPELVAALVTVGAGMGGYSYPAASGVEAALEAEIEAADQAGDLARVNELELRKWVDGPRRTPEQVPAAVRERVRAMNGANLARDAENERLWSAEERERTVPLRLDPPAYARLGEIHVPTLVIVGAEDIQRTLQAAHTLAERIPGAREVVMQGTAHLPNMEKPDEFNQLVLDFLATIA